jgi:hypothetical protein
MSRSLDWLVVTDVWGQPIGPIFYPSTLRIIPEEQRPSHRGKNLKSRRGNFDIVQAVLNSRAAS